MSLEKEFEQFFKDADLNEAETEYFTEDIKNAIQVNIVQAMSEIFVMVHIQEILMKEDELNEN